LTFRDTGQWTAGRAGAPDAAAQRRYVREYIRYLCGMGQGMDQALHRYVYANDGKRMHDVPRIAGVER